MPATRPIKITLEELRSTGLRNLLVYCGDCKCAHSVLMNADRSSGRRYKGAELFAEQSARAR